MKSPLDLNNKLMHATMLVFLGLALILMPVMADYAMNKNVVVTEDNSDDVLDAEPEKPDEIKGFSFELDLTLNDESQKGISIVLPYGTTEDTVDVSVRFDINRVLISLNGNDFSYLSINKPTGNYEGVKRGAFLSGDGMGQFVFELDEPMECGCALENGRLLVTFLPIEKKTVPVVVLDPGHGGNSYGTRSGKVAEKDLTLAIAKAVCRLAEDRPYKVYLVRSGDESISTKERLDAIEKLSADYYLGIHMASDVEDPSVYGMYASFNDEYYNHGISNSEYADAILRNTAVSAKNLAKGLITSTEEDSILRALNIYGTVLYAGYMTNPEELKLLNNEAYIEKIAEGILNGLDAAIR